MKPNLVENHWQSLKEESLLLWHLILSWSEKLLKDTHGYFLINWLHLYSHISSSNRSKSLSLSISLHSQMAVCLQEQFEAHELHQGHFDSWTGGVRVQLERDHSGQSQTCSRAKRTWSACLNVLVFEHVRWNASTQRYSFAFILFEQGCLAGWWCYWVLFWACVDFWFVISDKLCLLSLCCCRSYSC